MTDALFLLDTEHDDVPVNSDELNAGWKLTLPQSVRRHAIQAMRLKDGDELQLSTVKGLYSRGCCAMRNKESRKCRASAKNRSLPPNSL